MGVDISVSVGVGFVIDPAVWDAFEDAQEAPDDLIWELVNEEPLLTAGEGGSYYDDGDNNRKWISVNRLTKRHDMYDIPGGVFGMVKPTITLDERYALESVAARIGQDDFEVGQFLSVLWH